jgi:hypothetical protein
MFVIDAGYAKEFSINHIKTQLGEKKMKNYMIPYAFIAVLLLWTTGLQASIIISEGFETGIGDWGPYGGSSTITRVASGTNGIASSSGDYHAEIFMDGTVHTTTTANGGAYVYPGGTDALYPGFGKAIFSVDVYIDPAVGDVDEQWDMQVAFDFHNPNTTKTFSFVCKKIAADTWTLGRNSGEPEPISISEAGWYTMSTEWTETANGIVDYNYIYHGSETWEVGSGVNVLNQTAEDYSPRYMWLFGYDDISKTVAIDNSSFQVVPEPASLGMILLGICSACLLRKLR